MFANDPSTFPMGPRIPRSDPKDSPTTGEKQGVREGITRKKEKLDRHKPGEDEHAPGRGGRARKNCDR